MRFLSTLQTLKPSALGLLDMAYMVVLLPLLLMLKVPMLLFVFVVLVLLIFKKEPAKPLHLFFVFFLGILAIYLSLYGAFSFRGLSRLKLFIELLVYVLLVVVSLQRLTQKVNFYLLLSPFLLLALSLFFYHGMVMLFYVILEIFILLWLILAHRMEGDLVESFRSGVVMFMYSLPWVVVLFIFFPRISFEHATYGFKGEMEKRMGHDGVMYLDGNAQLVPSDRIVMEVGFDTQIPPSNALYFRGSILYIDKKDHWEPLPESIQRKSRTPVAKQEKTLGYKVTLYPTQKRWLYMLDMPAEPIKNANLDTDLISTVKKEIKEPLHYAARSHIRSTYTEMLDEPTLEASTLFDKDQNPQSYRVAQEIKQNVTTPDKRLSAILRFFKEQKLTYTLKPDALDTNHSTDSFLFDKKRGYCVHFASSFVTMARMAGIPARVVTGYKADLANSLNLYLSVKERDAHAWAEVYLDKHWVRVETTSTATGMDAQTQTALAEQNKNKLLDTLNLYLLYAKYQVETWILHYSNLRQLQLLDYAKSNPKFVFVFLASLIALVVLSFMIILYFRRPLYRSRHIAVLQPLFNLLQKNGHHRQSKETLHQYFLRYCKEHPHLHQHITLINQIDALYEQMTYADQNHTSDLKKLKNLVRTFTKVKND